MLFRLNRVEYSDGVIDLIPLHIAPPSRELGFGHEQVWRITLHNERQEIGQISYRDGESRCVYYYGHIGYHIDEGYRGHHYAYRACRLIRDEIRRSGKTSAVITCDPDNEPSRKTCQRLGCLFERITEVPEDIYRKYEINRTKCRYILHVVPVEEE
jgi:predicted acetyltransferase